jgi:hypothetical protein
MPSYPNLTACGIHYMHFRFHISGGFEDVEAFWEVRGLDPSKERLLFARYYRDKRPHTVSLQWFRSHEECCDVLLGIDAQQPAKVWPRRPLKEHLMQERDLRDFLAFARSKDVPWGIKARYAYQWPRTIDAAIPRLPSHTRIKSISFEVLDEKDTVAVTLTFKRHDDDSLAIVEPTDRFPFPEGDDFFAQPFETGCYLARSLKQEPVLK